LLGGGGPEQWDPARLCDEAWELDLA